MSLNRLKNHKILFIFLLISTFYLSIKLLKYGSDDEEENKESKRRINNELIMVCQKL